MKYLFVLAARMIFSQRTMGVNSKSYLNLLSFKSHQKQLTASQIIAQFVKLPDGLLCTFYFIAFHLNFSREKKALRVKDDRIQELEKQVSIILFLAYRCHQV